MNNPTSQYVFDNKTRALFGPGSLKKLHEELLPGKKALVVISSGGSMRRHGQLDAVLAELDQAGVAHVIYDGVKPNPTDVSVDEGATLYKDEGCDFVLALGGGSVMDAAKAMAMVATNGGKCWDYSGSATGGGKAHPVPSAPVVAITTSAGTGSEVNSWSVITNEATQEKTGYGSDAQPVIAVIDSDLMMSVPASFTAYQGMDVFYHASETVINTKVHPMAEMFALKAVELVAANLPAAVADGSNVEARANVALANSLASYYMLCTSQHTMEHAMGSYFDELPHGAGLIMISHEYFDFFAERRSAEDQMVKMAKVMGVEDATCGKDFIAALDRLIASVNCADLAMSDYGITQDDLPKFVAKYHNVGGGDTTADPTHLTDENLLGIYERSYK